MQDTTKLLLTTSTRICAFNWYQNHWPWMTLNWYKFKFSRNFALVGMFGRQQRLNEWRQTRTVSEGIVAHWKYFSTMYRLRWYCYAILTEGQFSELRPMYQGCRVLTFVLAGLSCIITVLVSTVQYTSVSHCSLNFEALHLGYGFLSIILVLENCQFRSLKSLWILCFEYAMNPAVSQYVTHNQQSGRCIWWRT